MGRWGGGGGGGGGFIGIEVHPSGLRVIEIEGYRGRTLSKETYTEGKRHTVEAKETYDRDRGALSDAGAGADAAQGHAHLDFDQIFNCAPAVDVGVL